LSPTNIKVLKAHLSRVHLKNNDQVIIPAGVQTRASYAHPCSWLTDEATPTVSAL